MRSLIASARPQRDPKEYKEYDPCDERARARGKHHTSTTLALVHADLAAFPFLSVPSAIARTALTAVSLQAGQDCEWAGLRATGRSSAATLPRNVCHRTPQTPTWGRSDGFDGFDGRLQVLDGYRSLTANALCSSAAAGARSKQACQRAQHSAATCACGHHRQTHLSALRPSFSCPVSTGRSRVWKARATPSG